MTDPQSPPGVPTPAATHWHQRLHYVTWLLIIATVVRLAADTVFATVTLKSFATAYFNGTPIAGGRGQLALAIASIIYTYSSSIGFVAAAASVEYLYRIWAELRRRRPA